MPSTPFAPLARAPLLALLGLLAAPQVSATTWCYDRYNRTYYRCLSTGERIAIGVCVGVGVFLIFMMIGAMRRKSLQKKFNQYRPPPPPTMAQGGNAYAGHPPPPSNNPYANNPPPPTGAYGSHAGAGYDGSGVHNQSYGNSGSAYGGAAGGVSQPPNSYQPQHGLADQYYGNKAGPASDLKTPLSDRDNELADHSYEYEQAQAAAANQSPPGYDVPSGGYAAPSGPPPTSSTQYAPPSGPPPGK